MMETIVKHGGACMHVTGFFCIPGSSLRGGLPPGRSSPSISPRACWTSRIVLGVYRARIDREDGTAVWFSGQLRRVVLFHQLADGDHLPVPV